MPLSDLTDQAAITAAMDIQIQIESRRLRFCHVYRARRARWKAGIIGANHPPFRSIHGPRCR